MLLVFWEKSFKCKEADYSKRLARSLLASFKRISPSSWIRCDKIKSPYQICQFLGTHNLGTPRVRYNYLQPIHRKPASLEYARTWFPKWIRWEQWRSRRRQQRLLLSLASSLLASLAGKDYTNFRKTRARTPNASHSFRILVHLARTVAAFTSVIM